MSLLPPLFAGAWSFTLDLPAWRTEIRHQGPGAIPNVPCRLVHFHSPLSACRDAETQALLRQNGIAFIGGFIGDPTWTAERRAALGKNRAPKDELGFVQPGASGSLGWTIHVGNAAEFEGLWSMVRAAEHSGSRLSVFLFGHAARTYEIDRGEQAQEAPIKTYRLIADHGDFPEP